MITVKRGDKYDVTFTVNADLTGATTRLLANRQYTTGEPTLLGHTVTDPVNGVVTHTLTGTLDPGRYNVELEATRGGETFTFPSSGFETLQVEPDLG